MSSLEPQPGLFAAPDAVALDVGAGGEQFVARTRLSFFAVVWVIPAVLMFLEPRPEMPISLVAASIAVFISFLFILAIRRGWNARAMPFVTSAFDVTIVSVTLVAFALIGRPHLAVNSMVVWEIYLLAIMATPLRFDVRVCLFAGVLAICEYVTVLIWVSSNWDVHAPDPLKLLGRLSWSTQVARILLMIAATLLSIASVVRSRKLIRLSGIDPLTGLPNRTYFLERLKAELARSHRTGASVAVAMLDLDWFKKLNDEWGHDTGDVALQLVGDVLRNGTRSSDLIARWGGEEFIVVFAGANAREATTQLNLLRDQIATMSETKIDRKARLTFSAGIARYPEDGPAERELITVADRRLLQAKALGRNRVVAEDVETQ